jgi:hypothetical protein
VRLSGESPVPDVGIVQALLALVDLRDRISTAHCAAVER